MVIIFNLSKLAYQYSNKSSPFTFDFNIDFKKNNKYLSNLTEEWSNHKMSNFEYIMTINLDGFPINNHLWTDEYLECDYIICKIIIHNI